VCSLLQLDPDIRQQGNPTSCKVVLFGAAGVGKTSIMRYFLEIPPQGQGLGVSLITAGGALKLQKYARI